MKGLLIFIAVMGLAFTGVQWFTNSYWPEHQMKNVNEAALEFYQDNNRVVRSWDDLIPKYIEERPKLYNDEQKWYIDPTDKNTPIKIYTVEYYTCPKDGFEIEVKNVKRPLTIKCEKCGSTYYIKRGDTHKDKKENKDSK